MRCPMDLTIFTLLLAFGHNINVINSARPYCNTRFFDTALCDSGFSSTDDSCPDFSKCCCPEGYDDHRKSNGSHYKVDCCDINECDRKPDICRPNKCENTVGSYRCLDSSRSIFNTCVEYQEHAIQGVYLEHCANQTKKDQFCSVVETFSFLNESCHLKNISKEKAEKELKEATGRFIEAFANYSVITSQEQKEQFVTEILRNMEGLALISFLQAPRTQTINTTDLDIAMKSSRDICGPEVQSFTLVSASNTMEVPCSLVSGYKGGAVLINYKGNTLFTPQVPGWDNTVINSNVVTGAITNSDSKNLSSPITFRLSHLQLFNPLSKIICVFWDPETNAWSEEGCETGQSDGTHTNCFCTHLSSFALLVALDKIEDDFTLSLLSYIGLSVSLLCLCLSLLTFILCRSLRSSHTSILTALCGCLFLGQFLFLVGIRQTWNKLLCAFIAGSLQFSFLSAFCWMSVESVLLFMTVRNLRAVNYMASRKSNFPVMCLLGFGTPAVIVGISAALYPHDYGTDSYCWLSLFIVWSFLGPALVLIITNTVLLVLTVCLLRKRLASVNTNVSTLKSNRLLTFKAVAQLFILGCTWCIGYFQFGRQYLVFSYLFTIFNSLQGVYIFLVHCLFNQQVRSVYCRLLCRVGAQKGQKTESSTTGTLPTLSKDQTVMTNFKGTAVSEGNSTSVQSS